MICLTCFCAARARRSARHDDGQLGYEQFVPWLADKRVSKVHEVLPCTSTDYEVWLAPIIWIHMVAQNCADSFAWDMLHSGRKHLTRRRRLYQSQTNSTQLRGNLLSLIRHSTRPTYTLLYKIQFYKYCVYICTLTSISKFEIHAFETWIRRIICCRASTARLQDFITDSEKPMEARLWVWTYYGSLGMDLYLV